MHVLIFIIHVKIHVYLIIFSKILCYLVKYFFLHV